MAQVNFAVTLCFSTSTSSRIQSGIAICTSPEERALRTAATSCSGHRRFTTSLLGKRRYASKCAPLHLSLISFALIFSLVSLGVALGLNIEDMGWDRSVASCYLSVSEDGRLQASPQFAATVYHSAKGIQGFEPVAVIGMCDFSGGSEYIFVPCESTEQPHHLSYQPATRVGGRAGQTAAEAPEEQKGWLFWAKRKATEVFGLFAKSPLERVLSYLEDRLAKGEDYWLLCKGYPSSRNAAFTPLINWGWTLRRYATKDFGGHVPTIPAFHVRS